MSGFLSGRSGGGLAGGLPNGVKLAAIAFLIHQLMKQQGGAQPTAAGHGTPPASGGGLGDILGGLLGQGGGAGGMAGGLGGLLGGGGLGGLLGGLAGMLGGMRGRGLSGPVDSWIAPGENQPVSPQDLEQHFDPGELDEAARQAGTDRGSLLEELSRVLPDFVDRMTPQGSLPQPGAAPQAGGAQDGGARGVGAQGGDLGSIMDGILRGQPRR